jgi:hypothetical protein
MIVLDLIAKLTIKIQTPVNILIVLDLIAKLTIKIQTPVNILIMSNIQTNAPTLR